MSVKPEDMTRERRRTAHLREKQSEALKKGRRIRAARARERAEKLQPFVPSVHAELEAYGEGGLDRLVQAAVFVCGDMSGLAPDPRHTRKLIQRLLNDEGSIGRKSTAHGLYRLFATIADNGFLPTLEHVHELAFGRQAEQAPAYAANELGSPDEAENEIALVSGLLADENYVGAAESLAVLTRYVEDMIVQQQWRVLDGLTEG